MNALLYLECGILIRTGSSKGFQVSHNRALSSAGTLVEFHVGGGPQILLGINVKKAYGFVPFPVVPCTLDHPVIAPISIPVAFSVGGYFLLLWKDGFDAVRVQVLERVRVREAEHGAARYGLGQLARGSVALIGVLGRSSVMGGSEPPERILCPRIRDKGDELLAASGIEILGLRIQIVTGVDVGYFDDWTTRDQLVILANDTL
jgi:hypothetical protein